MDRRTIKFLGWSSTLLGSSVTSRRISSSLFRLPAGDHSNCADWGRYLLLVYCWIWQCGTPRESPFRPHRHFHHWRSYFAHRSRILLLSNLGAEQSVVVDLLDHRCRLDT